MKLFRLTIVVLASIAILFSCSNDSDDSPTSPSTTKKWEDYYPLTVGSWWVYENATTDENYNPTEEITYDSVVVVGTETIDGKLAYKVATYSSTEPEVPSIAYFYGSGSKLFSYTTIMNPDESEWMMIADFSISKPYTLLDTTFEDLEFMEGMMLDGSMVASLDKGTNKTINLLGTDYTSLAIDMIMTMEGSANYMGFPIEINFNMTGTQHYIKNIGMALSTTKQVNSTSMSGEETEYYAEKLIRYNIAK